MADTTTDDVDDSTDDVTTDTTTASTSTSDTDGADWQAETRKWKALARKHENQAKSNADKAKRLDEIEESTKSESEKVLAKLAAAEERAAKAEQKALRAEVATDKGLTAKQAARLVGETREELEADADELLATFKTEPDKGKSKKDFGGGDRGSDVVGAKKNQLSRDQLKSMKPEDIVKAKAEGRLDDVLGIKN